MSFTALPLTIQIHAGAALFALVVGPFALWRKCKDIWHRLAGRVWIMLMLIVATSAWFIHGIRWVGPFGPIHLFAIWTYWSLFVAMRHVRAGRYRAHGAEMRSLYLYALGIAGLFTLLPGRAMQAIIFGDQVILGLGAMGVIGLGLVAILRRKPRLEVVR